MGKFIVHIYAVVRVPVQVEAESATEAARIANSKTDLYTAAIGPNAHYTGESPGYLVDEHDEKGQWMDTTTVDTNFFVVPSWQRPRWKVGDLVDHRESGNTYVIDRVTSRYLECTLVDYSAIQLLGGVTAARIMGHSVQLKKSQVRHKNTA